MQTMKKILALCLCAAMLLAGCGKKNSDDKTPSADAEKVTYTVAVKAAACVGLEDVTVLFYEDSTLQELVSVVKTDTNGEASFTDVERSTYVAVLQDVPTGYVAEEYYPLTGTMTEILLTPGQMEESDLDTLRYKLGDAVMNFTITDTEGKEYTFNELMQDKKAVVLNFFYNECQPCMNEFPYLQEAYAQYSEDIAVLAMNPVNTDPESVAKLKQDLGITFPMAVCDPRWEAVMNISAYPTTVFIDRFGNICLIHKGSVPDTKTFADAFAYFAADNYEQKLIEAIGDLAVEEEEGTKENPIEIGGVSSFKVTVGPDKVVYVNLYKVTKMYLEIKDENAFIIYKDKTYYPKNGKVSVMVSVPDTFTPVLVGIGNAGSETFTFKATISAPKGSFNNPNKLSLGDFTVKVPAGSEQGIYYSYTATEEGVLKLTCTSAPKNIKYGYNLFNTTTNAMRTLEEDAQTDENGVVSVSVQAKKGHKILVCVSTLPKDGAYPGGTFKFNATFTAGDLGDEEEVEATDYTVTITDDQAVPMPNVSVLVRVGEEDQAFTTDAQGVAKITLPTGTYEGSFYVPDGYEAEVTTFTLTEEVPNVTLTVTPIRKADYTVTVVDGESAPMADVLVRIGEGAWQRTDAEGKVIANLEVADYTVTVSVPEGYTGETTYTFPEGQTQLTVVLTKAEAPEEPPEEPVIETYTVTITDAFGAPVPELGVIFLQGGVPVKTVTTNAEGIATMEALTGEYTVELAFGETQYYYDKAAAVLTAENRSLTIKLASLIDETDFQDIYILNGNPAYTLYVGGTHVSLGSGKPNFSAEYENNCFFVFTPETDGTYQITAAPNVELSNWSTTNFISRVQSSYDEGANNALTISISGSSVGNTTYVIGVKADTQITETVVTIARIGDPEFSIADQPWSEWETGLSHTDSWMRETGTVAGSGGYTYNFRPEYLDITAADGTYELYYDEANGYYRLYENGPVVLVDMGAENRFVSLFERVNGRDAYGGSSVTRYFFDETGAFLRKEDYTDYLNRCFEEMGMTKSDPVGFYPLTKDMMHVLQNGFLDWWNPDSPNYLEGFASANVQYAWMFPCCIAK